MSRPKKILRLIKIVRPTRMWIDGKCFDICKYKEKDESKTAASSPEEDCATASDSNESPEDKHYDISLKNDQYCTTFRLPMLYYDKLRNFHNFSLKDLEDNTNTEIDLPRSGSEGNVVITGTNVKDVVDARTKLQSLFSIIRDEHFALQFITIPVLSEEVKRNFETFRDDILKGEEINGMHESIFQKPTKLHLTIAVFSLLDDTEISEAKKALDDCKTQVIDPIISKNGPLEIKISGLECMNADYSKVNVLYAKAKLVDENEEHTLQNLINSVANHFYERGLVQEYQENVKVHMTLINTKYRKVIGRKRQWADRRITLDATSIMEKYKDYDFGQSKIDAIHLCMIKAVGEDGFYKQISKINVV